MKLSPTRVTACLMSAALLLGTSLGLTSCSTPDHPVATVESVTHAPTLPSDTAPTAETEEEDHRFDHVNYKGRTFRIYNSINYLPASSSGSSNHLIEGPEEIGASIAGDAVIERNMAVEELLGVELEFTQCNIQYIDLAARLRTMLGSGDDEYDLIINKLYPMVNLSIEGHFHNTLSEECEFDFEKSYWYDDYMADLRMVNSRQHLLGGDFFIDIIRSSACLLYNKGMYEDFYQRDPNEVYTWVKNHEWTYEKLVEITADLYLDVNNDQRRDEEDRYGIAMMDYWGPTIAMVVSADLDFVTREEDGSPVLALAESKRASDLVEVMRKLNKSTGCSVRVVKGGKTTSHFVNGLALICDSQSLGGLENEILRDMEGDIGVIPYPLLYAGDERYVTSTGDVTEIGVIPVTCHDLSFVSTVTEVLNRESARTLIPVYYKECLQVQYVRDPNASEMVELIHDSIGGSFILGYNNRTGSVMLNVFGEAMERDRTFEASFQRSVRMAGREIRAMVAEYLSKNETN